MARRLGNEKARWIAEQERYIESLLMDQDDERSDSIEVLESAINMLAMVIDGRMSVPA